MLVCEPDSKFLHRALKIQHTDGPELLGNHHGKYFGEVMQAARRNTTEQLFLCFGFDRTHTKGRTGKQKQGESSASPIKEGRWQQGLALAVTLGVVYWSLFGWGAIWAWPSLAGHWGTRASPAGASRAAITCWLPQCPAQPLSPFTLLLIAHLITTTRRNCRAVLRAGGEADKEYLSLLSAQMCKSLFRDLWGVEQSSCFHCELKC